MAKPPLRGFEGDLLAVYSQIFETYGSQVTAELVAMGMLDDDFDKVKLRGKSGNALNDYNFHLWPGRNTQGVAQVPYQFADSFVGNKSVVEEALDDLEKRTGVLSFVQRNKTNAQAGPYLLLTSDNREPEHDIDPSYPPCWSYVGYQQQEQQELNLGPGCLAQRGFVQHMLLHALGFWHTSSRWDRDEHVQMLWESIRPAKLADIYFAKRTVHDTLGLPYDYASMMHYGPADFTPTINMVAPEPIGQLDGPSQGDILHMRLLYQCASGPRNYSDYLANPCTTDCKCWEMAPGSCHGNDRACQGDLACNDNQCVRPPILGAAPSHSVTVGRKVSLPLVVGIIIVVSGLALLLQVFVVRRWQRRQKYEIVV